jgi:hypothetical protein
MAFFQASTKVVLGDSCKMRFWMDAWLKGRSIAELAPDLVPTVPKCPRDGRTVTSALQNNNWLHDLTYPRTVPVVVHYVLIREWVDQVALAPGVEDRLVWRWCALGAYWASSAYNTMFIGQI